MYIKGHEILSKTFSYKPMQAKMIWPTESSILCTAASGYSFGFGECTWRTTESLASEHLRVATASGVNLRSSDERHRRRRPFFAFPLQASTPCDEVLQATQGTLKTFKKSNFTTTVEYFRNSTSLRSCWFVVLSVPRVFQTLVFWKHYISRQTTHVFPTQGFLNVTTSESGWWGNLRESKSLCAVKSSRVSEQYFFAIARFGGSRRR